MNDSTIDNREPVQLGWFARLQHRRLLKRTAKEDFRNARGSAHRAILTQAIQRLEKLQDTNKRLLDRHREAKSQTVQEQSVALNQALSRYIVETRLTEVYGIGKALQDRILRYVLRADLNDLRRASRIINGIGDSKQRAINRWIQKYQQSFPAMLQSDFDGKVRVLRNYEPRIKKLENEITAIAARRDSIQRVLESAQNEIEQLSRVTENDFCQALTNPGETPLLIEQYRLGIFAPWESAPDWFKCAIDESWEG